MAATSLGTTGNWGIPQDEAGLLIIDISFDFSNELKEVLSRVGEVIGLVFYKEKVDIKISALVPKTAPFSAKIGAALVLANAIPAHLQQATGGTTIITQITRTLNNEDFEKIEITAVHYPFVTVTPP